ncbi:hypothetical protein DYB37_013889 [Aphanomyces astaci]|uniref:Secreted protein n=1 Tax=Aphanomyces astaci TaxID=112090 RepID=A0A418CU24_APHAT|nr:hypothetical protein DYB35_013928 [Aphanomyces astaci]RHZ13617.1 hypothetical protein DYB37_013889 [Aphanomyces astaci]
MKSVSLFTAAIIATATAQQQDTDPSQKCEDSVTTVLAVETVDPAILVCAKDSGVTIDLSVTPTDADLAKVVATKSCTAWWDGVVSKVKAISPPCDFPVEGGSVVNTAKFNWGLRDFYAFVKEDATTTDISSPTTTTAKPPATTANVSTVTTVKNTTNATTTVKPDMIVSPKPVTAITTAPPAKTIASNAAVVTVSIAAVAVATMFM